MKRYRVFNFDFDSLALTLDDVNPGWDPEVIKQHQRNRDETVAYLVAQFGSANHGQKRMDYKNMGPAPFSIVAFHNKFQRQIRTALTMGSYYPALTSTCSLGERILNHLILTLREDFKESKEYKSIYRKDSYDDWSLAIDVLSSWQVLLPEATRAFRDLYNVRRKAVHFSIDTEMNDRDLAMDAYKTLKTIIQTQFPAIGGQPWFLIAPGEAYIRKDWETNPFVKRIYLPNCFLVGPDHKVDFKDGRFLVSDAKEYPDKEISDEEFVAIRTGQRTGPPEGGSKS